MFAVIFYRQPGSPTWNVLPTVYTGEYAEDDALADATMQASRLGAITMVMRAVGATPARFAQGGNADPAVIRENRPALREQWAQEEEEAARPAIGGRILSFPAGAKQ